MKKQYIRPAMQIYQLGLDESILMNVSGGSTDDRWSNKKEWDNAGGAMTTTPLPPRTKHPTAQNTWRTARNQTCSAPFSCHNSYLCTL